MIGNRSRDTRPEVALRRTLHAHGFRYRKNYRISVGRENVRPDIVFIGAHVAVFVDGCFWHRCPEHRTIPIMNRTFWAKKLELNLARDRHQDMVLAGAGWTVLRVWEHERTLDAAARVAVAVMSASGASVRGSP